jgi:hypothetical protein
MHANTISRRDWLKTATAIGLGAGLFTSRQSFGQDPPAAIDIGSRRELFIDRFLIDRLEGDARQRLHHPVPREISLVHDAPWEGTGSGYHSVFRDGDLYRMYYKAWHLEASEGKLDTGRHPLFCCYAESKDGILWEKPELGIHEFHGSKANNIVMVSGTFGSLKVDAGHPAVFKDENPSAPPEARYKAILRSSGPNGLIPHQSPDGIHWSPMTDAPILGGRGAFDSQNLAFWDPTIGMYRAYWRIFTAGVTDEKNWKPAGHRAIRTAVSEDLIHWEEEADVTYEDSPSEHLYTNQVKPYCRAPHILIGFPTRYVERGWSPSMEALPELEHRRMRSTSSDRYGMAITEGLLMASRDGVRFKRWNEAFLRPGIERPGTWHYGHQYIAWHAVETKSELPGAPDELSLYAGESYWTGNSSELRRYTLRLDGFVSLSAAMNGGECVSRPLTFSGNRLHLNFATSAAGALRVELQQPDGTAIPGFSIADCHELFGDTVDRVVTWKGDGNAGSLAGKPVRLRFELKDAELYSFWFGL